MGERKVHKRSDYADPLQDTRDVVRAHESGRGPKRHKGRGDHEVDDLLVRRRRKVRGSRQLDSFERTASKIARGMGWEHYVSDAHP